MKTIIPRTALLRMSIPVLLMALPGMAAVVPVSFDFGTDTGKITFDDAGFTDASQDTFTITDQPNSVRFRSPSNNQTGGITRTFDGLGDDARNDFTITTQFQLGIYQSSVNNFWRPASIFMFADGSSVDDMHGSGIAVILRSNGTGNSDATSLQILSGGMLGDVEDLTAWTGSLINHPDRFNLTVDVSFSGTNDMTVSAALTRLDDDITITASHFFADSASTYIGGDHFGFGGRLQMGSQFDGRTELESFAVIPEPGTLALVGIALGSLLVFRRRR